jgi:hypothetical protein
MPFQLINLFCRLAGNLAEERESFYEVVGNCNETVGMPMGTLLTPLSTGAYSPERRRVVDENIRVCRYFLLLVEDVWEAPVAGFLHDYRLALKCCADESLPMREVVVALKKTPKDEEPGDLAQFRAALAADGAPRHFEFATVEEFRSQIDPILAEWLRAEGTQMASASSAP